MRTCWILEMKTLFHQRCGVHSLFNSFYFMNLPHPKLVDLLQRAYSAEKAAVLLIRVIRVQLKILYIRSWSDKLEIDEWNHRQRGAHYYAAVWGFCFSKYYEFRFQCDRKIDFIFCYVIGWFMPYYFAGRLESENVCSIFVWCIIFMNLESSHDKILYEMGMKEKNTQIYFLQNIQSTNCYQSLKSI